MKRGRPPACIHCGSSDSICKGLRRTKQLGIRQIRQCKKCGRKFTPRHQQFVDAGATETNNQQGPDKLKQTAEIVSQNLPDTGPASPEP